MRETIADCALIGDLETAALVSAQGDLVWLCWPDFDSEACFASLLGNDNNGVWRLAAKSARRHRRYLPDTMVVETTHGNGSGPTATVTDFMPIREIHSTVVRIVRGVKGRTRMHTLFAPRFDYGSAQPRLQRTGGSEWTAVAGPNRLVLRTNVELQIKDGDLKTDWVVHPGETSFFVLQHNGSYSQPEPHPLDAEQSLQQTVAYWKQWISRSRYEGPYRKAVERSLMVLKTLTYSPSGGFVAAPTTSLPEKIGGIRNWDYRFCWLRDTSISLLGMLYCGYTEEAAAWLQWLSRSVAGAPEAVKTIYGITGKREHSEWEAEWLEGYRRSKPVRIGNKASKQMQLGIFGELLDALYRARCHGLYPMNDRSGHAIEIPMLNRLEKIWDEPDEGLWEIRAERRHFTHSKVLSWVAFDRGIRMVEKFGMEGPVKKWLKIRSKIHKQVCKKGFHRWMNSFTQAYGTKHMDAGLLLIPLVGFLHGDDPRVAGTVKSIEKHLLHKGFLHRYDTAKVKDGLPPGEGAFMACNFWLVDVYVMQKRREDARALFEKLLGAGNDLGLFAEEYDPEDGMAGNFPQAFSHIALIDAAALVAVMAHGLIGVSLIWDKVLLKRRGTKNLFSYVFWLGSLSVFGLALIPFGYKSPPLSVIWIAFTAGILHLVGVFFYYVALKRGEASETLAIVGGFSPVATALVALALLSSHMTG